MAKAHRLGAALLTLLLLMSAFALGAPAQANAALPQLPRADATGHVTIIVLDMSGSMSGNDPEGLRCSAANAYIDLSGPGNYIGLVGLDNNNGSGTSGGPHDFRQAQVWAQPQEMATVAQRKALRDTIVAKSNNCHPDGNTPTYDALNQSLTMLNSATQGGKLSGSVILLTDGAPDPNGGDQASFIRSELVPQFKSKGWPVDTVALGNDSGDFHSLLSDVAGATSGKFYDDSKGPVSGVSPLNLAPFFVDIFAIRNGRTPGPDIGVTALNGGTTSRNFSVGNFVSHLDVVAVKDQPGTQVTITSPGGLTISSTSAGAFVSSDAHYVIFSLDNPQPGPWQLNASGSGQFLMNSLLVSTLTLDITSPAKGKAQPLGQSVTITAALRDGGAAVVGGQFSLKAVVTYAGNGNATTQEVLLSDPNSSGNYSGSLTIPTNAQAGSYQIDVTARSASDNAVEAKVVAQFELFPSAVLISPVTHQPTTDLITAHVLNWDPALRFVYSVVPVYSWYAFGWRPSDWPLQGLPANPTGRVSGKVLVGNTTYTKGTVTATATLNGSQQVIDLKVDNHGDGNFDLFFPTNAKGTYSVTLKTTGSYKDSFGDLSTSSAPISVTVGLPSLQDELRAWGITLLYTVGLYLFLLYCVYGPINYLARPKPSGNARLVDMAAQRRARSRSQLDSGTPLVWRGWSQRRYFRPHRLPGGEMTLPNNVFFIFRYGNEVALRVRKPRGNAPEAQWSIDGRRITASDGPETLLPNMRISYSEGGPLNEYQFQQDVKGGGDFDPYGGGSSGNNVRDRLEDAAGNVGLRDRFRRARGLRND